MNNNDRKSQANRILYEFGLRRRLEEIGEPHIIGSYRMDMMAWNDLYSFEKFKSLDVYKAVLENDVVDVEEFLKLCS